MIEIDYWVTWRTYLVPSKSFLFKPTQFSKERNAHLDDKLWKKKELSRLKLKHTNRQVNKFKLCLSFFILFLFIFFFSVHRHASLHLSTRLLNDWFGLVIVASGECVYGSHCVQRSREDRSIFQLHPSIMFVWKTNSQRFNLCCHYAWTFRNYNYGFWFLCFLSQTPCSINENMTPRTQYYLKAEGVFPTVVITIFLIMLGSSCILAREG